MGYIKQMESLIAINEPLRQARYPHHVFIQTGIHKSVHGYVIHSQCFHHSHMLTCDFYGTCHLGGLAQFSERTCQFFICAWLTYPKALLYAIAVDNGNGMPGLAVRAKLHRSVLILIEEHGGLQVVPVRGMRGDMQCLHTVGERDAYGCRIEGLDLVCAKQRCFNMLRFRTSITLASQSMFNR